MKSAWNSALPTLAAICLLSCLGGCASPSDPTRMAIGRVPGRVFPVVFRQAMCVRNIGGGEDTNALTVSKVATDDFRAALISSMSAADLTAVPPATCRYSVDANLLGLSQPSLAFDMEVTSHVNYKVYDASGKPILLETISAAFTAKRGEAFAGYARLKLANEGAIRVSISQFMDKLSAIRLP